MQTYLVSESIRFSTKAPLILRMSAFFSTKLVFFSKNTTFTQNSSVSAVSEILD